MSAVRITLPNGTSVHSDSGDVDRVLSAFFVRNVTLARVAPNDFTIDQYHPDVEAARGPDWPAAARAQAPAVLNHAGHRCARRCAARKELEITEHWKAAMMEAVRRLEQMLMTAGGAQE